MKRLSILLVLVGVFLALLTVPSQAQKASYSVSSAPSTTVVCSTRHRWATSHINDGTVGADEWWFTGTIYYQYCEIPNSADSIRPLYATGHYNFEGSSQNCKLGSNVHVMKYVDFNGYFWDGAGRNYNPGAFRVPCSERSYKTVYQDFNDTLTHLYTVDGVPPKFKFNWTLVRTGYVGDVKTYGTVSGYMRKCSGPGSHPCK